jgi:RNA polymerase sigma-70 factor (ECF subfamily)
MKHNVDQELVARAQKGDVHAFELLVLRYQKRLARLLSKLLKTPEEIEEIVQESFVKVYKALPNFRGDSSFYTWIYRIAINTAKNYLVSHNKRVDTAQSEGFDEDGDVVDLSAQLPDFATPETHLQNKQILETVYAAMDSLPEDLRVAVTLREIDGFSYEEIAEIMDCPVGTVRSRIFRAREAIASKLKPLLDNTGKRRW